MRRFWLGSETIRVGEEIEISGDEFKHICIVCRMSEGSKFEVLTSNGEAFFSELTAIGKKSATLKALEVREVFKQKKPWLRLIVSLPKFSTFELIVEKSVELGVKGVQPVFSDYSFVRTPDKVTPGKTERWAKIMTSATRQTGRGDLMEISQPIHLKEVLEDFNRREDVLGLFPYEGPSSLPFNEALQAWDPDNHSEIWCFVGSEGGFSDQEVKLFQGYGVNPSTLGEQVLRVETACLALSSIIKYHTGQLS